MSQAGTPKIDLTLLRRVANFSIRVADFTINCNYDYEKGWVARAYTLRGNEEYPIYRLEYTRTFQLDVSFVNWLEEEIKASLELWK